MRKKLMTILSLLLVSTLIAGCSSGEETPEPEETPEVTSNEPPKKTEKDLFIEFKEKTINDSNELLTTFNNSLNGLYTGTVTSDSFSKVVADLVVKSQQNIQGVEKEKIDSKYLTPKQDVINHLNIQHDLFLNAVDMANNGYTIDKEKLRRTYLEIKQDQNTVLNNKLN